METLSYTAFLENYALPESIALENQYDILIIGAESWRWDTVTPEIMPRLSAFAAGDGWLSPAHFTTGTTTPEGLFGVCSGTDAMFWYASSHGRHYPLFFKALKKLGYQNTGFSSSTFAFKDMDKYVFGDDMDELLVINEMKQAEETITWKSRRLELEDQLVLDEWVQRLDDPARDGRPSMDFLFFYVTHYNYYYPDEFEKFTPAMSSNFSAGDLNLRNKVPELYNRYLNSVHYLDHLIGEALDALESRSRLERTIVMITGDHGEEFFERGRFSHSMAVHNYQTRVPLVVHVPGRKQALDRYSVTSHADIAPTVLGALGVDLPLRELFSGNNLLDESGGPGSAIVATQKTRPVPMEWAFVDGVRQEKYLFDNLANSVRVNRRVSMDDDSLPDADAARTEEIRQLLMKRKRHFVRD